MTQSNTKLNNIILKTERIFGNILLYSVIIFTTLSALFGGVIFSPIYALIIVINKVRGFYKKPEIINLKKEPPQTKIIVVKKPLIDETWCNLSVKNIIDYDESEDVEEEEDNTCDNCDNIKEDEDDLLCHSCYHKSCEENGDECWCKNEVKNEVKNEILSLIPPNELDTIEEEDTMNSLNNYRLNYRSDHNYLPNYLSN